jgi:hypothetical protein
MLAYSRTKSIGVQKQSEHRRVVSGILEDELYAMTCVIAVDWPSLTIESVHARMKRFTTARCILAEKVFAKAEGWKLDPELDGRIKKELGRKGCRHMASLIGECVRALVRAEFSRELLSARERDEGVDGKEFLERFRERYPGLAAYLSSN